MRFFNGIKNSTFLIFKINLTQFHKNFQNSNSYVSKQEAPLGLYILLEIWGIELKL